MLDLKRTIEKANAKRDTSIAKAYKNPKLSDKEKAKIDERSKQPFHERLVRNALSQNQNATIKDIHYRISASITEMLFLSMYDLAWGMPRQEKKDGSKPSEDSEGELLSKYFNSFSNDCGIKQLEDLVNDIESRTIDKTLTCHGLSAIDDSVLLLAELGRNLRISQAMGIDNTEILLADMSWIKYNRSLNKLFSERKDFQNALRVCADKRIRLYESLNLSHRTYGFSDFLHKDFNLILFPI